MPFWKAQDTGDIQLRSTSSVVSESCEVLQPRKRRKIGPKEASQQENTVKTEPASQASQAPKEEVSSQSLGLVTAVLPSDDIVGVAQGEAASDVLDTAI